MLIRQFQESHILWIKNGSSSSPCGISYNNKINQKGYIDGDEVIRVFELTWKFKIRITNNSELTAFYPELSFNPNGPKFTLIDKLNKLQPLKPTETIELNVEYKKYEEKTGKKRTDTSKNPTEFTGLGLQLLVELVLYYLKKKVK